MLLSSGAISLRLKVDEERKILDSQIGVLHERLKVQATEHELLLQKLQQAKKDLNGKFACSHFSCDHWYLSYRRDSVICLS